MSPAPTPNQHHPHPRAPRAEPRHAHFADDEDCNGMQPDRTSKEQELPSTRKSKTPTSQTVFLEDSDDDDDDDPSGGAGEQQQGAKEEEHGAASGTARTEEDADGSPDSSDSDSDDEEAKMRSRAFQRRVRAGASSAPQQQPAGKGKGPGGGGGGGGGGGVTVKRYDEYADFLTRSERSRRDRHRAKAGGQRGPPGGAGTGRVGWRSDLEESVAVLPELDAADALKLYMTRDAWERIDMDLELTRKRWDNHAAGLIAFDFLHNTVRGMESMLDEAGARKRDSIRGTRVKAVLNEQNRQRVHKEYYDAAKMRKVAEQSSLQEEASRRGHADAEEAINIWLGKSSEAHRPAIANAGSKPSKGSSGGGGKKKKNGGFNLLGMFQGKHKK